MANSDVCIFCEIIAGKIPCHKIYEDDNVISFLDIGPISSGHTLVVPKQHFVRVDQCPEDVISKISVCISNVSKAVLTATEADGYNVLCNNGRAAGQIVDHVHFHIVPRYDNDGLFNQWPSDEYPEGQGKVVADSIREKLVK